MTRRTFRIPIWRKCGDHICGRRFNASQQWRIWEGGQLSMHDLLFNSLLVAVFVFFLCCTYFVPVHTFVCCHLLSMWWVWLQLCSNVCFSLNFVVSYSFLLCCKYWAFFNHFNIDWLNYKSILLWMDVKVTYTYICLSI